jgi:mRNA-degrading endonuclease RelE of RelBE toxin-antitoxin system
MNYKTILIDEFKRDAKKLLKKYASLKNELVELEQQLLENPTMGTLISEHTYKIRLAVKSKGKGKRGGLRVITHIIEVLVDVLEKNKEDETTIVLVAIYDKSEMENISENYLKEIISEINDKLDDEDNG